MLAFTRWSRLAIASRLLTAATILVVVPRASAQGGADLAVAKKCFEDVWVRHDTTAVARCQAPSFPEHGTAGDTVTTHASTYAFLRNVFTEYPDMKGTILEQLPHGDRIITRWRVVGTKRTTKKQLAMNGIAIDRIAGGKVVESWGAFDNLPVLVSQGYTITPPISSTVLCTSVGLQPAMASQCDFAKAGYSVAHKPRQHAAPLGTPRDRPVSQAAGSPTRVP